MFMKLIKSFAVCIVCLWSFCLPADGRCEEWIRFIAEVAKFRYDDTNRVYYAGFSNNVSYLYHESSEGISEWHISNINLSNGVQRAFSTDKMLWVIIKDDKDEKFTNWDTKAATRDFVARLPSESALVQATEGYLTCANKCNYRGGTPMLVSRHEYRILATKSHIMRNGDIICLGWPIEGYEQTTNVLASSREYQRHSIADGRMLYVTWNANTLSQGKSRGYYYVSDEFAVPLELVWDSDINHEALIPFDEKMVVDAYLESANKSVEELTKIKDENCDEPRGKDFVR